MALNPPSPTPSLFGRKKSSSSSLSSGSIKSAASYLAAVKQADASARARGAGSNSRATTPTPTATPALSFSSSVTVSSDSTIEEEDMDQTGPFALPAVPPTSEQVFSTVHTEFGHCANQDYRYTSQHTPGTEVKAHVEPDPPYYILLTTYISYLMLICMGHVRDFFGKRAKSAEYRHLMPADVCPHLFTSTSVTACMWAS
jgi:serine palmitoyltransferase